MRVLYYLLRKEFRQIFRDRTILAMLFAMPMIQLVVLPLAMDFDVKQVNLVIVDHDYSVYSQKLIHKICSSGYFKLISIEQDFNRALSYLEREDADMSMEIPMGFEQNLIRNGRQSISLAADAINGTKAGIGSRNLSLVIADFNAQLITEGFDTVGDIRLLQRNWFNPLAEYKFYVVPAILVLLLTLVGGFMTALNIVREKELGTIEQINVSPVKKWQFILGKLLPFWVVGMMIFSLGLLVCRFVYGIVPVGNIFLLYAFAMIYLIALLGFGLLISTYSENQVQAMFIAFFFIMIFMLMSGFFTATESMPTWARFLSELTPVTHFVRIVRMIMLKGSAFEHIYLEFGYLCGFAVFLNAWAIWNYRKTN